jgi:hypothetical protein
MGVFRSLDGGMTYSYGSNGDLPVLRGRIHEGNIPILGTVLCSGELHAIAKAEKASTSLGWQAYRDTQETALVR